MKSGIDYFPLDCQLDDKFELIEAEFGLTGFAVVVKLLQKIYAGQGYYCEWTSEVALLFGKKLGLGGNAVSEIVEASIRRGIFDSRLYEKYSVLTSRGIQERYLEAVSRRKKVEFKKEYLLLCNTQNYKNVDISAENVYKNQKNADTSKQSKVKESRGNKSKVNIGAMPDALQTALSDFIKMRKAIKKPLTDNALQRLINKLYKLSADTDTQIAILNQSTDHCWQDLYELKNHSKKTTEPSSNNIFLKMAQEEGIL